MKTFTLPLAPFVLALILLGSSSAPQAHAHAPAAAVCIAHASPPMLLGHWTDALRDRSRMIQVAFLCILFGIFLLRWGGR